MPFHIIREGDAPPPESRPQDPHLDGRDLKFETLEHGGAEPDTMPNAIRVTDPQGRVAVYVLQGKEAHLSADAADMLAALHEILADAFEAELEPGYTVSQSAIEKARAAVARAEGRAYPARGLTTR